LLPWAVVLAVTSAAGARLAGLGSLGLKMAFRAAGAVLSRSPKVDRMNAWKGVPCLSLKTA
jgi:hypothetical protein